MTTISKQAKISARKLIRENFILCFVIALFFTLPSQIYYMLPIANDAISYAVQFLAAPLVLAGCKVYCLISMGDDKISALSVFSGYGDKNNTNLSLRACGKGLIVSAIYILVPAIVILIAIVLIYFFVPVLSVFIMDYAIIVAFIALIPFMILAQVECSCIYLGAISCFLNNEEQRWFNRYVEIFKAQKMRVFLFSIGPTLLFLVLVVADVFLFIGSNFITYTLAMMYLVACYTFYAKYTIDARIQNGHINANSEIFDENKHTNEQKYAGVDRDLL